MVFVQGCPHHCEECHNKKTWDFSGGSNANTENIIIEMKKNPLLTGLTLSGGEPFCQAKALCGLAKEARKNQYSVWCYTGYTFEQLQKMFKLNIYVKTLLENIDVLVDGKFDKTQKSYDLIFKGSKNQRIIDVQKTLKTGTIQIQEI